MELLHKPDFDRAKLYWRAFWEKEIIDRPVICVTSPKDGVHRKPAPKYMAGFDGDFASALQQYDEYASTIYFGGEAIPYFEPSLGPDQFSAFIGAELSVLEGGTTSWVKPFVTDWRTADLKLDPSNPSWKLIRDFYAAAAEFSNGRFLLSMLDMHSNMDCLSAIRGPQDLCYDLIDCPDEVEEVLKKVRSLYLPVLDTVYELGDMKNRGCIGWAPTYCEDKFAVVQCDFICMISPKMARRYAIPAIIEEASSLDHCVYHYDGKDALRHIDDILAIKEIDVIQWIPGDGQPRTIYWMDLLKKIQAAGKGLWIFDWTIDEIKRYYRELKPEGLVFQVSASSQAEADEIQEWLVKNT